MCLRIQLSRTTVKELHGAVCNMPISVMMCDWYGASQCCSTCCAPGVRGGVECTMQPQPLLFYHWRRAFLLWGMDSLVYRHGGSAQRS